MKFYAIQTQPEYQEPPLYFEEWPENVFVFGNRHYKDHGGEYIENIKNSMFDAADELKALPRGRSWYNSFIDIINDLLPAPENKKEYSRADRLKWRDLLSSFTYYHEINDDIITTALELITGREYDAATIRGCCQGDWNNVIYPAEYGRKWLKDFEIEYFNMGDEWRITTSCPDDDSDDSDGYYFYSHAWNDDEKRAEIADAAGVDPADVILYCFDGYIKTASYKVV